VSYGKAAPKGTTYRKMMMGEVKLDMKRIHFVGTLAYDEMVKMLQVSAAHIYLTYPFVLSWSLMESMAIGCAIVASDTKPVLEVMEDGVNGLLAGFFDPEDVAKKVVTLLKAKDRNQAMRDAARKTIVERYELGTLLPLQMKLVREIADGKVPPPVAKEIRKLLDPKDHTKMWWSA
jgi:glycosyltransferase involved in cell wall biosynthesis